jgi:hypothetical protein
MQKFVSLLSGLLLFQGLIIAYMFLMPQDDNHEFDRLAPLVTAPFDDFMKIEIFDKSDRTRALELAKSNGRWTLPSKNGFPVSTKKVDDIGQTLLKAQRGYPVGNTLVAAKSFSLTDENFEKKLVLHDKAGETTTVLLGSNPGAGQVYARLDGEPHSFVLRYGAQELGSSESQWIDSLYLRVNREDVRSVYFSDVHLKAVEGTMTLADLKPEESLNETEINDFFSALRNLNVLEVLPQSATEGQEDQLSLEVEFVDDMRDTFLFYANPEDSGSYLVQRTSAPFVVKISAVAFNALNKFSRSSFISEKEVSDMNVQVESTENETSPLAE